MEYNNFYSNWWKFFLVWHPHLINNAPVAIQYHLNYIGFPSILWYFWYKKFHWYSFHLLMQLINQSLGLSLTQFCLIATFQPCKWLSHPMGLLNSTSTLEYDQIKDNIYIYTHTRHTITNFPIICSFLKLLQFMHNFVYFLSSPLMTVAHDCFSPNIGL